ncbi:RidA family protein [Miniimonas sp. S16]|uniref:RidA family protein n=1 Tax=Miniimonas sp. S16 TaxID=2171623 RepID=UPI000D52598A|nr:RidA family protein [Miniimonas sp. S16]
MGSDASAASPASPSERLAALGLELPPVAAPVAAYVPAVRSGNLVQTSGQLPFRAGALLAVGKVGDAAERGAGQGTGDGLVSPALAAELAQVAALNALAAAADVAGGLDRLARVVKVVVFVASAPTFTGQPAVANGASELLGAVLPGGHARSAVGVAVLPLDAPVEVEITVELA